MKALITLTFMCSTFVIQAQNWKPMLPGGGNINCSVNTDSGVLIGTNAGIYITKNDGVSFSEWSRDIPSGPVTDLHQDANSKVLIAVIEDKGIYRSVDFGKNWSLSKAGRYLRLGSFGTSDIVQAGNGIVIRSYSADTFVVSTNAGLSWTARKIKSSSFNDIYSDGFHLFCSSNKTLGDSNGLYRSDDLGQSWVFSNKGLYGYWGKIIRYKNKTYALNQHIFESNDSGKTWQRISTDTVLTPGGYTFSPEWIGTDSGAIYAQNGGNWQLAVCYWKPGMTGWKKFDGTALAAGNTLNFVFLKSKILLSRMEHCLFFDAIHNVWNNLDKKGISNIPFSELYPIGDFCYALQGRNLYTAHEWDNEFSSKSLNFVSDDQPFYTIRKTSTGFVLFGTGAFGTSNCYSSTDGNTWVLGGFGNSVPYAPVFSFGDSFWQYSAGVPILVESYHKMGKMDGTRNAGLYGTVFDSYMASMIWHNGNIIGLVSDVKRVSSILYKFDGTKWVSITSKINGVAFSGECLNTAKGNLYMGMANGKGVMVSTDNGLSWTDFSTGLNNLTPNVIGVCGDTLLIGTEQGLFMRRTGGSSWVKIHHNLPSNEIDKIEISAHYIWVLLRRGGIWRIPREGFVASLSNKKWTTINVWPNPAKNTIQFEANYPELISRIQIYNLNGILCFDQPHSAQNTIQIESKLSIGMYYSVVHFSNNTKAFSKIIIEK